METFEAQTIDEAIAAASAAFKADRDQLDIQVLEQPRHGFLGFGRRNAKIQAELKRPVQPQKPIVKNSAVKSQPAKKTVVVKTAKPTDNKTSNRQQMIQMSQMPWKWSIVIKPMCRR